MHSHHCPSGWVILMACLLATINAQAQNTAPSQSKNTPLWVKMMDDTAANYYVAKQDYEAFWKGKEKPEDEEEIMAEGVETVKEHLRKRTKRQLREERLMDYYRHECKRFENWLLINKPFVQNDGRILTEEEKLQLWKDSQKSKP